jgi:hypothetical protein
VDDHAAVDNSRTRVRRSSDTQNKRTKNVSAQAGGHPIGVCGCDYTPHSGRVLTLRKRFVDRPPTQVGEIVVRGETLRVNPTERLFEP